VLPDAAPAALHQMLDTPGGARALAAAARSLLVNNPILQHPGAPCHALLTQLASLAAQPQQSDARVAFASTVACASTNAGTTHGIPPTLPPPRLGSSAPPAPMLMPPPPRPSARPGHPPMPCHRLQISSAASAPSELHGWTGATTSALPAAAEPLRRDVSSEAVEVLSSNFFTTRVGRVALSPFAERLEGGAGGAGGADGCAGAGATNCSSYCDRGHASGDEPHS